ncbi:tetratricopeptide repeat protein 7B-like [Schistocerca americana]|uniref:tetratricopeptide repeat protein 7B-like n=1 Tax=Schistocerca americana TaxID=7009 RepID=UPI001F4FB507|nr:tetratricopeptide repeat protein 7B-like [Schistocerca americana]XP_046989779.1 tetratricopeptide repeat protein 7B-like [Schistocerca americana]XP_046989780.1 tetratricopeptide repeat protein 7B-like [Schistocerca americana]XP_046989781.1 tetratricopeptide repeat protein 7B-like [Schistocerca americana]XP_046989782.1 tetratricopeptide repeat protein 7B-like [Schistocerca americana]XP_046989783.1 tetratricopeptide repeat protein 7B-like [Schistocerca americana]XP_046989784.1 tetratricopept
MKEIFINSVSLPATKQKLSDWDPLQTVCLELSDNVVAERNMSAQKTAQLLQSHLSPNNIMKTADLGSAMPETSSLQSKVDSLRTAISNSENTGESSSSQSGRHDLTRQLAEILLRGRTETNHRSALNNDKRNLPKIESQAKQQNNLFVPCNDYEEIILLLLISEATAVHEVVLSQSPEFKEARVHAFNRVVCVYDLLTVLLVRWGCFDILHESFERAMKFSFEEPHIWIQEALSLACLGKHTYSLKVLKEVSRLIPNDPFHCLLAARCCYEHLNQPCEGTEWSHIALSQALRSSENLTARCHLFIGIGYSMQALVAVSEHNKCALKTQALQEFHEAQKLDPNDHLPEYYLGFQYALEYQLQLAVTHVKRALNLQSEHLSSLHLLVLLLSAQKQSEDALQLITATLEEYPDCINLLYTKAQLELQSEGKSQALLTARRLLHLWNNLYKEHVSKENTGRSEKHSDNQSTFKMHQSVLSDKDSTSLQMSIAPSHVEQTLSDVATSLSSFVPRPGPQSLWLLQLKVWLLLAEIYISLDSISDAAACLQEAQNVYPMSHNVMYVRGLLHEHKKEYSEAVHFFQNAASINPKHVESLQHLGLVYYYLGSYNLAEKTLRDALKIDPSSYKTWHYMSLVLESLGEYQSATDCIAAALERESTCPVLPFSAIPFVFD